MKQKNMLKGEGGGAGKADGTQQRVMGPAVRASRCRGTGNDVDGALVGERFTFGDLDADGQLHGGGAVMDGIEGGEEFASGVVEMGRTVVGEDVGGVFHGDGVAFNVGFVVQLKPKLGVVGVGGLENVGMDGEVAAAAED